MEIFGRNIVEATKKTESKWTFVDFSPTLAIKILCHLDAKVSRQKFEAKASCCPKIHLQNHRHSKCIHSVGWKKCFPLHSTDDLRNPAPVLPSWELTNPFPKNAFENDVLVPWRVFFFNKWTILWLINQPPPLTYSQKNALFKGTIGWSTVQKSSPWHFPRPLLPTSPPWPDRFPRWNGHQQWDSVANPKGTLTP